VIYEQESGMYEVSGRLQETYRGLCCC